MDTAAAGDRWIGKWAAVGIVFLGLLYLLIGALWFVFGTEFPPQGFEPAEPIMSRSVTM